MSELKELVVRAKAKDEDSYSEIVRRFQDMAYGYAYSMLGDHSQAEDAAQQAFVQAYKDLNNLHEPAAFPGWFRRILLTQCYRIKRRKRLPTVPLDEVMDVAALEPGPQDMAEMNEVRDVVRSAINSLPSKERIVTTLYYIDGYSQNEIGEFLNVPVTTVDGRIRTSRKRLKERMIKMVKEELQASKPGKDFRVMVKRAIDLYKDFKHQEAIEIHQKALSFARNKGIPEKDVALSYIQLMKVYYSADRQAEMAEGLMCVVNETPATAEAYEASNQLSEAANGFLRAGQLERSVNAAKKALQAADMCIERLDQHTAKLLALVIWNEAELTLNRQNKADEAVKELLTELGKCEKAYWKANNRAIRLKDVIMRFWAASIVLRKAGKIEKAIQTIKIGLGFAQDHIDHMDYHSERMSGLTLLRDLLVQASKKEESEKVLREIHDELMKCEDDLKLNCPGMVTITDAQNDTQREWFRTVANVYSTAGMQFGYGGAVDKAEALRTISRSMELFFIPDFLPDMAAYTLSVEGDREKSLFLLKKAMNEAVYQRSFIRRMFHKWDDFESVREDPDFLAVIKKTYPGEKS